MGGKFFKQSAEADVIPVRSGWAHGQMYIYVAGPGRADCGFCQTGPAQSTGPTERACGRGRDFAACGCGSNRVLYQPTLRHVPADRKGHFSHRDAGLNAVEIEEAVSRLVEQAFGAMPFPYQFLLEAFGNKPSTIKRLQAPGKSTSNKSDITGDGITAVLQRNNIHIATSDRGGPDAVAELLDRLTRSVATAKHKAKFALATDG